MMSPSTERKDQILETLLWKDDPFAELCQKKKWNLLSSKNKQDPHQTRDRQEEEVDHQEEDGWEDLEDHRQVEDFLPLLWLHQLHPSNRIKLTNLSETPRSS